MKPKISRIIVLTFACFMLASPLAFHAVPAHAAESNLVPCGNDTTHDSSGNSVPANPCSLQDIFTVIAKLTNWLISLAGLYAVARIVISGAQMVFSGGNQKSIDNGKRGLSGAVQGIIIIMIAFLLVNTLFIVFEANLGLPFNTAIQLLKFDNKR